MHVTVSSLMGIYIINDAFKHSKTTQASRYDIMSNKNIKNQILKRHNTMRNRLGVDMSHMNIK